MHLVSVIGPRMILFAVARPLRAPLGRECQTLTIIEMRSRQPERMSMRACCRNDFAEAPVHGCPESEKKCGSAMKLGISPLPIPGGRGRPPRRIHLWATSPCDATKISPLDPPQDVGGERSRSRTAARRYGLPAFTNIYNSHHFVKCVILAAPPSPQPAVFPAATFLIVSTPSSPEPG